MAKSKDGILKILTDSDYKSLLGELRKLQMKNCDKLSQFCHGRLQFQFPRQKDKTINIGRTKETEIEIQ